MTSKDPTASRANPTMKREIYFFPQQQHFDGFFSRATVMSFGRIWMMCSAVSFDEVFDFLLDILLAFTLIEFAWVVYTARTTVEWPLRKLPGIGNKNFQTVPNVVNFVMINQVPFWSSIRWLFFRMMLELFATFLPGLFDWSIEYASRSTKVWQ